MTGGAYVIHDSRVSSPSLSATAPLSVALLEGLAYHQPVHSFATVPTILEKVVTEGCPSDQLAALKVLDSICVGGAPTSEALYDWAARENIAYVDYCGATEVAGGLCTAKGGRDGFTTVDGLMGVIEKESLDDDAGELIIIGKVCVILINDKSHFLLIYTPSSIYRRDTKTSIALLLLITPKMV